MKKFVANQIYYIAMLSYKKLNPEELKDFSGQQHATSQKLYRLNRGAGNLADCPRIYFA